MEFFKALGWDEVDNDYKKKISDKFFFFFSPYVAGKTVEKRKEKTNISTFSAYYTCIHKLTFVIFFMNLSLTWFI